MRPSAAHRILAVSIPLLLASHAAARGQRPLGEEKGRELLGPDGRTLTDKANGFSIVLPSPAWKVAVDRGPATEMNSGWALMVANPQGDMRVRVLEKIYPLKVFHIPVTLEMLRKTSDSRPDPRERNVRTKIIEVEGTRCLEREGETNYGKGWGHQIARICDRDAEHKLAVSLVLPVPVEQWPAEENDLRELVESFRVHH